MPISPQNQNTCRDLKLDNTLLDRGDLGDSYPPIIKLCDFGFAKGWTGDSNMYTHIGYALSIVSSQSFFVYSRDLKLDNTLLTDDEPPILKLCDFGFSREWSADAFMYTHIGCGPSQLEIAQHGTLS